MISTMTYWNMGAYSDGGKMRPKGSTTDIRVPTLAQARRVRRRGWAEIDDVGIADHITNNQRGRR